MSEFPDLPVELNRFFPNHGYALNIGGYKQVRLPILQLCDYGSPTYGAYDKRGLSPNWVQARSPRTSFRMLVLCLADLNSELETIRQGLELGWGKGVGEQTRNDALSRKMIATARAEIQFLGAFVLLRRLADQIIETVRPLLFQDWQSAPRHLKTAITAARQHKLGKVAADCDQEALFDALLTKTQWFEALRQEEGIRDILIHKDHVFRVGGLQIGNPGESAYRPWRVTAELSRIQAKGDFTVDVIPVLREAVTGLCQFSSQLCRALRLNQGYAAWDMVYVECSGDDQTAFWPELESGGV